MLDCNYIGLELRSALETAFQVGTERRSIGLLVSGYPHEEYLGQAV